MNHILPLLDDVDVPMPEDDCTAGRRLYDDEFRDVDATFLRYRSRIFDSRADETPRSTIDKARCIRSVFRPSRLSLVTPRSDCSSVRWKDNTMFYNITTVKWTPETYRIVSTNNTYYIEHQTYLNMRPSIGSLLPWVWLNTALAAPAAGSALWGVVAYSN